MNKKDSLGYSICTTARKIHRCLTARFEQYDITPEQWVILRAVFDNEGISQKKLAELVGKDPNNVKVLVDKLVKKALLVRQTNPEDKRAFSLFVMPNGRVLNYKIQMENEHLLDYLAEGLSGRELNRFLQTLAKINETVDADEARLAAEAKQAAEAAAAEKKSAKKAK
ncbi:MAG: MarR family transcriptional regulator [Succiniclasticum sp.]|jgi:DNA-binding MarR family transcriptional regulator|nr:MarR family transcriptional regulator [Succiniclasticum sp.]MEE3478607.1 MarR family transcriptional regulator [Succiniclasticum sp.]